MILRRCVMHNCPVAWMNNVYQYEQIETTIRMKSFVAVKLWGFTPLSLHCDLSIPLKASVCMPCRCIYIQIFLFQTLIIPIACDLQLLLHRNYFYPSFPTHAEFMAVMSELRMRSLSAVKTTIVSPEIKFNCHRYVSTCSPTLLGGESAHCYK